MKRGLRLMQTFFDNPLFPHSFTGGALSDWFQLNQEPPTLMIKVRFQFWRETRLFCRKGLRMQPGWRQPSLDTSQLPYGRCLLGPHRRSVWLAPTLQSLSRVYKTKIFSPFLFTRCALSTAAETAALRQIAPKLSRTLGGAQRKAGYSRRS